MASSSQSAPSRSLLRQVAIAVAAGLAVLGITPAAGAAADPLPGTIIGSVTSTAGGLDAAVQLYAAGSDDITAGTGTNTAGEFVFSDVAPGDYQILATAASVEFPSVWYGSTSSDRETAATVTVPEGGTIGGIDIVVEPSLGSFGGTITLGGVPVQGATIIASHGSETHSALSGPDGSYLINNVVADLWDIVVYGPNPGNDRSFSPHPPTSVTVVGGAFTGGVDVHLEYAATAVIEGVVRGDRPQGSVPLDGLAVTVRQPGGDPVATRTTDAGGAWSVTDLLPGEYEVEVAGFGAWQGTTHPVTAVGGYRYPFDDTLTSSHPNPGALSGTLQSVGGTQNVASVVTVTSVANPSETWSVNAAADFAFGALVPGDYIVHFEPTVPGFLPEYWQDAATAGTATPVTVTAGTTTHLYPYLANGPTAYLRGTVTDELTGNPIAGGEVVVLRDNGSGFSSIATVYTDSQGRYSAEVPGDDEYYLRFLAAGYQEERWQDQDAFHTGDPVYVAAGATIEDLDVALTPNAGALTINLSGAGDPVVPLDGFVVLHFADGYSDSWSVADGQVVISDLAHGDVIQIFATTADPNDPEATPSPWIPEWYSNAPDQGTATPIVLQAGVPQTVNIVLANEDGSTDAASLGGRVTAADAPDGLEGRTVVLQGGSVYRTTTTDADGYYVFEGLPAGDYAITFYAAGPHDPYATQFWPGASTSQGQERILLTEGEERTGVDAVLLGTGAVAGTIYGPGGVPLEFVGYLIYSSTGVPIMGGQSGAGGEFLLEGVTEGEYTIVFSPQPHDGYVSQWWSGKTNVATADRFTVTAGEVTTGLDVTLAPSTRVSGTLTAGGAPLAWAEVGFYTTTGVRVASTMTQFDGTWEIVDLAPGSYHVRFANNSFSGNWAPEWWNNKPTRAGAAAITLAAGQVRTGINAALALGSVINGLVSFNGPVEEFGSIAVQAIDENGAVAGGAIVRNEGEPAFYEIANLPAGDYTLRFLGQNSVFESEWWDDSLTASGAQVITLLPNETRNSVDATLEVGATIRGTVTVESGTPLDGVQVHATTLDGSFTAGAAVRQDGTYTITGLVPGEYEVEARAFLSAGQWWDDHPADGYRGTVTVAQGGAATGIDFSLVKAGQIKGTVYAGGPVPMVLDGVTVDLYELTYGTIVRTTTTLGGIGAYSFYGVAPGIYAVVSFAPGGVLTYQFVEVIAGHESLAPDLVLEPAPPLTAAPTPTVSGTRVVGETLTASAGTWKPAPVELSYQWNRGGIPIPGATGTTYTLTLADAGYPVTVTVTGSKEGYATQSKTSAAGAVVTGGVLTQTPDPVIYGTPAVGSTLSVDTGVWMPGAVILTYRWYRDGVALSATGATYKLVSGDGGHEISVTVTGSRPGYTTVATSSEPLLIEQRFTTTPAPTISGTLAVGQTLTANNTAWGPGVADFEWQWFRNGVAVPGETDQTYTLSLDDAGQSITVALTGSQPGFTTVTKTSAAKTIQNVFQVVQQPVITGVPAVGQVLSVDAAPATWTPNPGTVTYRWYRDGVYVSAGATRTVAAADAGTELTVIVTGALAGYTSVTSQSEPFEIQQRLTTTPTPTITGTARVGNTLTANSATWEPAPVDVEFQWKRDGVAIDGALGGTYEVALEDAGHVITVTATGSKTGFTPISKTSAGKTVESLLTQHPVPTIAGVPAVGQVLTATAGTWEPAPVTLKYQWKRNGANVGSNSPNYTLVAADAGAVITVTVTGSRTGYTPVSEVSEPLQIESALTAGNPAITGLLDVGQVLTANPGTWAPLPVDFEYQWNRGGVPIDGANEATYELQPGDAGAQITVTVTGSKPGYTAKVKTSAIKTIKLQLDPAPTPVIVGTPTLGTTLSVDAGTWGPAPVTLTTKWYRDGVLIKTGATYKVVSADIGHHLHAEVTGTKSGYSTVTSASDAVQAG